MDLDDGKWKAGHHQRFPRGWSLEEPSKGITQQPHPQLHCGKNAFLKVCSGKDKSAGGRNGRTWGSAIAPVPISTPTFQLQAWAAWQWSYCPEICSEFPARSPEDQGWSGDRDPRPLFPPDFIRPLIHSAPLCLSGTSLKSLRR